MSLVGTNPSQRRRYSNMPFKRRIQSYALSSAKKRPTRRLQSTEMAPKKWWNRGGTVARGIGETIGGQFGNAGKAIGGWLGGLFHNITGIGDYQFKHQRNSLLGMGTQVPRVSNSKCATIIRHREYIGDVFSSTGFVIQYTLPINPGSYESFPWLAAVASNYQEYRFRGILFDFKSNAGDAIASQNNSLGSILMSTQYNSNAAAFENKQQMLNEEFACDFKPSVNGLHGIECARAQNPLGVQYVRSSAASVSDTDMYDLGTFYLATQGMQTGTGVIGGSGSYNLGELWATYEVELLKPQLSVGSSADTQSIYSAHYQTSTSTNSAPFNAMILTAASNMGTSITATSVSIPLNGQFTAGDQFLIAYQVTGTAVALSAPTWSVNSAASIVSFFGNDVYGSLNSAGSAGVTTYISLLVVSVVNPLARQLTISVTTGGTLPSSATSADLVITQINRNLTT